MLRNTTLKVALAALFLLVLFNGSVTAQFVYGNAANTFHVMGGISTVAPASGVPPDTTIQGMVTFSRDWNPGKRSLTPECSVTFKSAASVCQMLMNQVRVAAGCELRTLIKSQEEEAAPDVFPPPRNG